jgi:short-subunit dehydrogenase
VAHHPARPVSSPLLITPRAWLRRVLQPNAPSPLRGRTVLVTGASSGIGEVTAHAAAARGATVLLVARRADRLAQVLAAIEQAGGTAHAYPCDLTEGPAVDRLVATLTVRHGAIDYLVNNAGRSIRRSIALSYDRAHDVERTMAINYVAPVRLMLGLLPHMVDQRFGHVVNVLTWGVQVKAPKFSAYIASKTALDTWSRIAGRELYADGVTFSNLRLPLVRTDMIGPTDTYANAPALSAEQAAARVVRALEDRPLTDSTLPGNIAEILNLVAPRASDALQWAIAKRFPDSAAASGATEPQRRPSG